VQRAPAPRCLAIAAALALAGCATLSTAPDGLRSVGAGMTAHAVCSGAFVAHRPWRDVLADDVLPASPVLRWVDVTVDEPGRSVTARMPGVAARTARWLPDRGCVLDAAANAAGTAARSGASSASSASAAAPTPMPPPARPAPRDAPWPAGDRPLASADWGAAVDAAALARAVDAAFEGAGDPKAANTRGLAVVHRGRLLVDRGAPGFAPGTPLHGWSMTKTVVAMLAHAMVAEGALDPRAPVVDAFAPGRAPAWRDAWRGDARARIAVDDLLFMRDGLANVEDYAAGGSVTRMLFGTPDVAGCAAAAPAEAAPGERWRYLSATTNLLSRTMRGRVERDEAHWSMPRRVLFEPIGARSATLETDADGTWIGSSFLWASTADWARLGELALRDGRWGGRQVLPPGFLARASTPALAAGPGRGYGMQAWRIGDAEAGRCRGRVPADAIAMSGHWGQIVAIVPSREAVIVRMGWTFDRTKFDDCALIERVLATLR
jgi:CubicO group peptidase (beta-lactamase class C family)